MICTLYSHQLGFERIRNILQQTYPNGKITISQQDEFDIALLEIKGSGLFSSAKKLKISYRQRAIPSYQIPEVNDSPLTGSLKGLYGFVSSLPAQNETIRGLFLRKILTLNCEFSVIQEQGEVPELKTLIQQLAREFDAILFVQPLTVISKSDGQHFLDSNLNLILDTKGNCEIDSLIVNINPVYFDQPAADWTDDQKKRKATSEQLLVSRQINVNKHLPCVASENDTRLRTPQQIAQRICVLAMTNMVAFGTLSSEDATGYLQQYNLWQYVTPNEQDFLANPTEDRRNQETWKCEAIWTLMWALGKVDTLAFPDKLCNLDDIPYENYPVGPDKDPNDFINGATSSRSKAEILDANDLHYRLDWACVDARIKGQQLESAIPSVVYERHYALNWLIEYKNQEWDDVSCDT